MEKLFKDFLKSQIQVGKTTEIKLYFEVSIFEEYILKKIFPQCKIDRGVSANGYRYVDFLLECSRKEFEKGLERISLLCRD